MLAHQFVDDGLEPVLDHVLSPALLELRSGNPSPFLAVLLDELEDYPILLVGPASPLDVVVQVVLPAFPALLGGLEEGASGFYVEVFGNLVPLAFLAFSEIGEVLLVGFSEVFFLFFLPGRAALALEDGEQLVLEEGDVLAPEDLADIDPGLLVFEAVD